MRSLLTLAPLALASLTACSGLVGGHAPEGGRQAAAAGEVAVRFTALPEVLLTTGISTGSPCPAAPPAAGANEPRLWVPDGPPRAYVDGGGATRLIVPHLRTYAFVGATLHDVKLRCDDLIADSAQLADPNAFDDSTWPWAPYRLPDGRAIVVNHHEYHPPSHGVPCLEGGCWFAALTLSVAQDGVHFQRAPGAHVVARAAGPLEAMTNMPRGYSDHTNIAQNPADGRYYLIAMRKDPVLRSCVLRTHDLLDAGSWRSWNGSAWTNRPALGEDCVSFNESQGAFAPGSLSYSTFLGRFVYLTFGDVGGRHGFYMFLAEDNTLTRWGAPILVVEVALPWGPHASEPGRVAAAYPSFLDPAVGGTNFDRIGEAPYLYFVYGPVGERRLTRVPVRFVKGSAPVRNRLEGFYRVGGGARYSNGYNQFCGIGSMEQLRAMGYAHPFEHLSEYPDDGALADAGLCGAPKGVPPPKGCYRIGGGGFYSNGQGQSCTTCPEQIKNHCGVTIAEFNALPPRADHGGNQHQGWCAACPGAQAPAPPPAPQPAPQPPAPQPPAQPPPPAPLPPGCYRIGGGGFYSNGQGQSCTTCPNAIKNHCGVTIAEFNALPPRADHGGNQPQGWCQGCP